MANLYRCGNASPINIPTLSTAGYSGVNETTASAIGIFTFDATSYKKLSWDSMSGYITTASSHLYVKADGATIYNSLAATPVEIDISLYDSVTIELRPSRTYTPIAYGTIMQLNNIVIQ